MKSVLLVGLGRFGRHIAIKLHELHHQVMAIDQKEERVEAVLPYVTNAQIGDSKNHSFMASLGVRNFDVCIVAIGDDFQSSLETTALLKELGAKQVVARAARDVHAKFLLRNGADEVVYPEKQMAKWTAILAPSSLSSDVVSSELWKSLPMATIHTSKLRMPRDSRNAALVLSPICALVTNGSTASTRSSEMSTAMTWCPCLFR